MIRLDHRIRLAVESRPLCVCVRDVSVESLAVPTQRNLSAPCAAARRDEQLDC